MNIIFVEILNTKFSMDKEVKKRSNSFTAYRRDSTKNNILYVIEIKKIVNREFLKKSIFCS